MTITKPKPKPGSVWRHHSGRTYRVLFITNDVEDPKQNYQPTVVYEGISNKKLWSGPLSDWHRRMELMPDFAQPKTSDIGLLIRDKIEGEEFTLYDLEGEVTEVGDDQVTTVDVSDAHNPIVHTESGNMFRVSIVRIG